jgi:outer membrane protein OmpU
MKKVLFATTALVATAGVASADVAISGFAEMGVIGGSDMDTQFHTDIDVTFTMSGTTDNGLTFGATIDLDEEGGFGNTNGGPESVFISGNFGTVTMGDTDGALDWAVNEVGMAGSINDDHTSHAGYSGNGGFGGLLGIDADSTGGIGLDGLYDGQVLRYDYTMGVVSVGVSMEVPDGDVELDGVADLAAFVFGGDDGHLSMNPIIGIGARYSMGDFDFGIGYQTTSADFIDDWNPADTGGVDFDSIAASVGYSVNGLSLQLNMGRTNADANYDGDSGEATVDHIAIGASYSMDAWTFAANWGQYDLDYRDYAGNTGSMSMEGYGLAVNYDLGGGAVAQFGYGHSDVDYEGSSSTWSLGLAMSF